VVKEKQIVKLQVRALHIGKCPPHGHNFIRICGVRELQGTKVPWVRNYECSKEQKFQGSKVSGSNVLHVDYLLKSIWSKKSRYPGTMQAWLNWLPALPFSLRCYAGEVGTLWSLLWRYGQLL